jgi:hypothetical protein
MPTKMSSMQPPSNEGMIMRYEYDEITDKHFMVSREEQGLRPSVRKEVTADVARMLPKAKKHPSRLYGQSGWIHVCAKCMKKVEDASGGGGSMCKMQVAILLQHNVPERALESAQKSMQMSYIHLKPAQDNTAQFNTRLICISSRNIKTLNRMQDRHTVSGCV